MARQIALAVGPPAVLANVAGIGLATDVLETSDENGDRSSASTSELSIGAAELA
ncbi:hypothetical protein QA811_33710 [Streptomyces sp. B21-102]|uniref:hypothetical protein n=1 Tax=Streptomyces sp. B21-102 TaxID=3039416 RepID=UPI002FF01F74